MADNKNDTIKYPAVGAAGKGTENGANLFSDIIIPVNQQIDTGFCERKIPCQQIPY
jgi:hypothetical protein